jgi:hypothetical protein
LLFESEELQPKESIKELEKYLAQMEKETKGGTIMTGSMWWGAHFVTIRLALNGTFWLNYQQKFNFWAAGRRKFLSSSTLLDVRYVPSPYRATTVTQLWATGGKYWCLQRRKTHFQLIVVDCRPWRLAAGFQQQK